MSRVYERVGGRCGQIRAIQHRPATHRQAWRRHEAFELLTILANCGEGARVAQEPPWRELHRSSPAIAEAVRGLNADDALIDGEAVVFQDDGRSDFNALLTKRGWIEAAFVAFDLLRINGDDLRQRPLEKRREALVRIVAKRRSDGILFSEALAAEGAEVFAKACELGLEGIVSKRAGSFYKSGKSRNWLKTINPDFVRT